MIYNIDPYEVNDGIAIELLVELQESLTTSDRAMVYYHLRNLDGITLAFSSIENSQVELPYKILFQEKLIITGNKFQDLMSGAASPLDIVLAERPDIRLKKRTVLLFDDCFGKELGEFYLDNEDFSKASNIYIDEGLKEPIKYDGKISDNNYVGVYSSKNGLQEIVPC